MKELIDADMVHQRLAKEQIVKHKRQTKLGSSWPMHFYLVRMVIAQSS